MAYKRISPIPISEGGTAAQSFTSYAPVCSGTVATGALQSATTGMGTSGLVFTSNGNSSLPSFKTHTGSCILYSNAGAVALNSTGGIRFIGPNGNDQAAEPQSQIIVPYNCTASNLYVQVTTNGNTASGTVTLRQNGSSTALVATITANTTGVFKDTNAAHNVTLTAGDKINFTLSQATAGNTVGVITVVLTG